MKKLIALILIIAALGGCAGRTIDDAGKSHPNGVVYYDDAGNLRNANPERISPESQDNWQTVGTVVGIAGALAGTALGIVALTK